MKRIFDYFLKRYSKDNFKLYYQQKVLISLDLIGFLLTLIQIGVNLSFQKYDASVGRTIILPALLSATFFANLFLVKFVREQFFAGNVLVVSLLLIQLSFLYYFAPEARFTYFVAGFYHVLLFYALSAMVGNKNILWLNTFILLVGFNFIFKRAIPGVEADIQHYTRLAYANYQISVIALGVILYSGRWLSEKAFERLKNSEEKARQYSGKLVSLLDEVKLVVQELSNISSGFTKMFKIVSNTSYNEAANIEEISSSIEENSNSLAETAQNSATTEKFALKTINVINENLRNFEKTAESIETIKQSSIKINEIASKTELLAVNAAIEAARSKNSTQKGFSVIAQEIKKLALITKQTANYIQELVSFSTELSKNSTNNILDIKKLTTELDERIKGIAFATQEQQLAMKQINNSLVEINNSAQENSSLSENMEQIVKNLDDNIQKLQKLLD